MKLLLIIALVAVAFLAFSFQPSTLVPVVAQNRTQSVEPSYENYDIRSDAGAVIKLAIYRGSDRTPSIQTSSSKFKIEYNDTLEVAEIIDQHDTATPLIKADKNTRARSVENFISANENVFGIRKLAHLTKTADYTNPDGNLSFVRYEQRIAGIPVFAAEINAAFSKRNEMFRVINTLAPHVDASKAPTDFGDPGNALISAASQIGIVPQNIKRNDLQKSVEFTSPSFTEKVMAEKFYFPVGNGVLRPSWRVMLWTDDSAYYVIVDVDGTMLWRKGLTEHQTNPATYNVYGNSTSLMKTADSPSPFTPGCFSPTGCAPAAVARTNFTLIGNEAPYTFNNLGWIPDTGLPVRTPADPNITDGNNVEAGIDRDGVQGIDINGWGTGNPTRVFSYTFNPAPGIPPPGEEPLGGAGTPSQFQQGSATHGFYLINRWHDEMYRFGFNEQARNFQHFNFGRGGAEGDRVLLEIQDISGTNGSTFSIGADGNRPRIQTFIWTNPTPDRDGALDSQLVTHEMTHGLSLRLIGNATGLGSNMSRGMGEGWSDFYAVALLSEPFDDPLGIHAFGGYATFGLGGTMASHYYGIRRFPFAVLRSTGPNGLPHNPLTFRYINAGCDTLIGTFTTNPNSAYPRNPVVGNGSPCDQVHNMGEVWSAALWEVRDQLIQRRFDAAEGNRRVIQYVTDGMKLSPLNPTILQMRDSILAAVAASDATDLAAVWRGFAIRGMGLSAVVINAGSGTNNTVVVEAFDLPPQYRRPPRADFDGDMKSDVSVFRPSNRIWYINRSTTGFTALEWGLSTDKPIVDDFDGDGKADFTVFRATADGTQPDYYTLLSATSTVSFLSWGSPGDTALTEDFDGDNKADHTIFRPSTGQFWVRRSTDGSFLISRPYPGTTPLVGDFDGDGRGDFATFSNGLWLMSRSEISYSSGLLLDWGMTGDRPVPADYDGDGKDDFAVYRPSNGTWYIIGSAVGTRIVNFGISTDIPVPADYDGDARADVAVYRDGTWYINRSTGGVLITGFGLAGDTPLPSTFVP